MFYFLSIFRFNAFRATKYANDKVLPCQPIIFILYDVRFNKVLRLESAITSLSSQRYRKSLEWNSFLLDFDARSRLLLILRQEAKTSEEAS